MFKSVGPLVLTTVALMTPMQGFVRAAATPQDKCAAAKMKAAAKKAACQLLIDAKATVKGGTPDYSKCTATFTAAFAKVEATGGCATTGDAASIERSVDEYVNGVFVSLANRQSLNESPCRLSADQQSCIGSCGSADQTCSFVSSAGTCTGSAYNGSLCSTDQDCPLSGFCCNAQGGCSNTPCTTNAQCAGLQGTICKPSAYGTCTVSPQCMCGQSNCPAGPLCLPYFNSCEGCKEVCKGICFMDYLGCVCLWYPPS